MDVTFLSAALPFVTAALLVGAAIYVLVRGKAGRAREENALREQLASRDNEIAGLRMSHSDLEKRLAVAEHKAGQLHERELDAAELRAEANRLRERREVASNELAAGAEAQKAREATIADLRDRISVLDSSNAVLIGKAEAVAEVRTKAEEELGALRARLSERTSHVEKLEETQAGIRSLLDQERQELANLNINHSALQQLLDSERRQGEEKLALLIEAKEQMAKEFKLLAGELLKQHGEELSKQTTTQIAGLLDPMRVKLSEFQQGLQVAQTDATKERASLGEQIRALSEASARMSGETRNLTTALKGKAQTQGAWGEMILSTILEKSGLRKDNEYHVQQQATNDDGARLRPDVIVSLPGEQRIVIDAKVSLKAFEQAVSAEDDEARQAALGRHLDSMRGHIKALGSKDYHRVSGGSLDYVIMFVPIEGALAAALDEDPSLTATAAEYNVAIATPTTLMIALRTVANLWHVERRNRNAEEIASRAGKLYEKFVGFLDDLKTVGGHIDNSRRALDGAMGKLSLGQGNLVRQVEILKQLGAKTQKSLPQELLDEPSDFLAIADAAPTDAVEG